MRQKIINFTICCLGVILFLGCQRAQLERSQTLQVTIISPMIKINDVGFLHTYKNGLNLQIYNSGVNTANLKSDSEHVCVGHGCFERTEFNEKFFLSAHYERIFDDILQGREIFGGEGLVRKECGFEQNISKNSIKYEVCGGSVKFSDAKNRVKIILKELK